MKIQMLRSGLGNQIWHYSFVRFAERFCPEEEWIFDDSYFFVPAEVLAHKGNIPNLFNGYELENVFGLKLNLLSKCCDKSLWNDLIKLRRKGVSTPQILLEMGMNISVFEGCRGWEEPFTGEIIQPEGKVGFNPAYVTLPRENVYYHCNWSKKDWFMSYREENLVELAFPSLPDNRNIEYADMIANSFSVGIHVRRGDFLPEGFDLPAECYYPVCAEIVSQHRNTQFFVFSDDIPWCKENQKEMGLDLAAKTTYVSGNVGKNSYIDMQLLSMCRGIVRNELSSFSQVAGWLNRNLQFEVKLSPRIGEFKWIETPKST